MLTVLPVSAFRVKSPVLVPELDPVKLDPDSPPVQLKAPVEFTIVHPVDRDPPPINISPVEVPLRFKIPVAPPSIFIALTPVDVIVPAPTNDSAVALTPIVSIEETPVRAPPVVTFNPPLDVSEKVPVPFPIAVLPVDEVFKLSVGAVIAAVPDDKVCVNPVSPVKEIDPEVEVRLRAPVVIVKPFDAVNSPTEVTEVFPVRVVKVPAAGVPDPIAAGDAQVPPNNVDELMVPELAKFKEAPVSTTIVAMVFVPEVIKSKEGDPPVVSAEHSHKSVVSFHFRICPSVHP